MPKSKSLAVIFAVLSVPYGVASDYGTNFPPEQQIANNGHPLNGIVINSPSLGMQTIEVGQGSDRLLCHDRSVLVPSEDEPSEGDYEAPVEGSKEATSGITSITVNGMTAEVSTTDRHYTMTSPLAALAGENISLSAAYNGEATELRFYVDCDHNGVFSSVLGECFATSSDGASFGEFGLPEMVKPGVYRARLEAVGDCVVDFPLSYRYSEGTVTYDIINGMALTLRNQALANTARCGEDFVFKAVPSIEGFETSELTIRHGLCLDGPQMIHGNRQWSEYNVVIGEEITVSGENMDGDLLIYGVYGETPESEWTPIWSDEFDGDTINMDNWRYCERYGSTWNKRIARGDERPYVNKVGNGSYQSYAIATPAEFADSEPQPMITGAIESNSRFYLTGGRIEAKIRSRAHRGSFPAFWMMPVDGSAGWPVCGEIDIWEQIDNSRTTYHTVHSGWTKKSFGAVSKSSPNPGGTSAANREQWHVYALEWDKDEYLKWYMDGKLVFTYNNAHFSEGQYTEDVTWPFGKAFYVILNQSVGDGSWAADCDAAYEYLTEFDYVRAYQRKGALDYYSVADGRVDSAIENVSADSPADGFDANPRYYNLQGIEVRTEALTPGIYIERCGSRSRKIAIRQ